MPVRTKPQSWSRRSALAGVAALLPLLAGCGGSDAKGDDTARPKATESPSASASHAALPAVEDIVKAGGARFDVPAADWIQVVGGTVWTTLASAAAVRLDPETGMVSARISTKASTCLAMDSGSESLWVGVCSDPSTVIRIHPNNGRVLGTFKAPGMLQEEGSLAAGSGAVWAVTAGPDQVLLKIHPDTDKVTEEFPIAGDAAGVRAGLGGLWLTDPVAGELVRIDPRTGRATVKVKTGAGARFFAVGEGGVWVQNNTDGTVTRVNPATNQVEATIKVDEGPISGGDLAIGGGFVWARTSGALVAKIDPRTNTVVARYGPASGSGSVAADSTALWVTAHDINAVYRLPLR